MKGRKTDDGQETRSRRYREEITEENPDSAEFARISETYARMSGHQWKKPKKKPRGGLRTRFRSEEQKAIDTLLEGVNSELAAEIRRLAYNCERSKQVFVATILLAEANARAQRRANAPPPRPRPSA